jgi:hypothetical protein
MVHYRIEPYFEDYKFTDLLTAMFHLSHQYKKGKSGFKLLTSNNRKQLQSGDEAYVYRVRKLEKVGANNE